MFCLVRIPDSRKGRAIVDKVVVTFITQRLYTLRAVRTVHGLSDLYWVSGKGMELVVVCESY